MQHIFDRIVDEHDRTVRELLRVLALPALLESHPMLRRTLSTRATYLLPRHHPAGRPARPSLRRSTAEPQLERALLLTIDAIASGLRNTG